MNLKRKGLIIIAHGIHADITEVQCRECEGFPSEWGDIDIHFVKVQPLFVALGDFDSTKVNWSDLEKKTEGNIYEETKYLLKKYPDYPILYVGFAPIPLMIHLGSLIGNSREVFALMKDHNSNKQWYFERNRGGKIPKLKAIKGFPQEEDDILGAKGDIGLYLSVSHLVSAETTKSVMNHWVKSFDLSLENVGYDVFTTQEGLQFLANEFDNLLLKIAHHYPKISKVHLFASIPTEIAFIIGTKIQPNMHPTIQTYQYRYPVNLPALTINPKQRFRKRKGKRLHC